MNTFSIFSLSLCPPLPVVLTLQRTCFTFLPCIILNCILVVQKGFHFGFSDMHVSWLNQINPPIIYSLPAALLPCYSTAHSALHCCLHIQMRCFNVSVLFSFLLLSSVVPQTAPLMQSCSLSLSLSLCVYVYVCIGSYMYICVYLPHRSSFCM
jgi:hypothetical protein